MKTIQTAIKGAANSVCNTLTSLSAYTYIRSANIVFVVLLTYTHSIALHSHYDKPLLIWSIWYLCDKLFILLVYLGLLCFVKNTFLKWEVFTVVCLSIFRLLLEVWETIDWYNATTDTIQYALILIDVVVLGMLFVLIVGTKLFQPNAYKGDAISNGKKQKTIKDDDIIIGRKI